MAKKPVASLSEPAAVGKGAKKYTVGTWSGLPMYTCTACGADDTDEARIKRHIKDAHSKKERPSMILGPDGKTLTRPAAAEPEEEGDE